MQPGNQIGRGERRVGRQCRHIGHVGRRAPTIFEAGQNAGERPGEIGRIVGQHRQAEAGEARRIAVGADRQSGALRAKPPDRVGDQRPAGEQDEALVGAAEATPPAAVQHEAEGRPGFSPRAPAGALTRSSHRT